MRLAAVRIPEREVHAWHFLVLKQNADHFAQSEIRSEGKFADAIAVFVGVAVIPEVAFEISSLAARRDQAPVPNLQHERRSIEASVFGIEVIARGAVAHERAINGAGRGEHLAGRQVRPVARIDQPARLHPGTWASGVRREIGYNRGSYTK